MTMSKHMGSPKPQPAMTLELTEAELFVLSRWAVLATDHAMATENIQPALSLCKKVDQLVARVGLVELKWESE